MRTNELARPSTGGAVRSSAHAGTLTPQQVDLLRTTIARNCSDDELALFLAHCNRTGLDPFLKQIHAIKSPGKPLVVHVGIDGHRLVAERSGKWEGTLGPFWCGPDGRWRDVWLEAAPPVAARVGILKRGFREPVWGVVLLRVCQNSNAPIWNKDPAGMLAKCAEMLAIRRALPMETSGLYGAGEANNVGLIVDETTGELLEDAPALPLPPTGAPARATSATATPAARHEATVRAAENAGGYSERTVQNPRDDERRASAARETQSARQQPAATPGETHQLFAPEMPEGSTCEVCGRRLTKGMWSVSQRSHERALCPECQKTAPTAVELREASRLLTENADESGSAGDDERWVDDEQSETGDGGDEDVPGAFR